MMPANGGSSGSWLTTYGDMVTLLLTFFVLLFSFSTLDLERFRAVMQSFQGSLGVLESGMTISDQASIAGRDSPMGQLFEQNPLERELAEDVLYALSALQATLGLQDSFWIEFTERGLVIHFTDRVLFDTGKAELKPEARELLAVLAGQLKDLPQAIRVEGHTDNVPIHNAVFPSNWELSAARAVGVVRYLIEAGGIDPRRLAAVGYGEYRPIASNETAEGRARNRRVDIVLLNPEFNPTEPVVADFSR